MASYGKTLQKEDQCCRRHGKSVIAKGEEKQACCDGQLYSMEDAICSPNGQLSRIIPDYMFQWDYEGPGLGTRVKYGDISSEEYQKQLKKLQKTQSN